MINLLVLSHSPNDVELSPPIIETAVIEHRFDYFIAHLIHRSHWNPRKDALTRHRYLTGGAEFLTQGGEGI